MPEIRLQVGAWLLSAKVWGIGDALAFAISYRREHYNGGKFWRVVIDASTSALILWFIHDLLSFAVTNTKLADIGSVFIGYLGADYICGI